MMIAIKRIALTLCLAASVALPLGTEAMAEGTGAPVPAPAAPAPTPAPTPTTTAPAPAKPTAAKTPASGLSEADRRAKAEDCSRQADAKKLHGEKRKTFREECKTK